jgi:hypothetical protein
MHIRQVLLLLLLFVNPLAAQDRSDARAAREMWSAFECFQLAQMSEDSGSAERLFEVGYKAGQRFLAALEAGELSEGDVRATVPIGVILLLSGPSRDFIIGRVFQSATGEAFESVVKENELGLPLPESEWLHDDDLIRSRAQLLHLQGNCDAL